MCALDAFRRFLLGLFIALIGQFAWAAPAAYDPLVLPPAFRAPVLDLSFNDAARQRELPLRAYLPASTSQAPVVIFSHGLGGSRNGSAYLGQHWAGRGYVAIFMQHPGSDTSVWQDLPSSKRMQAMREAAGLKNFMLRVKDVPALLDQLERWNHTGSHPLAGRLDLARIGMSGHSFGAVTAQAVSGEVFLGGRYVTTDPRIKAAILFSPSSPRRGDAGKAFGKVAIPWLLITGTRDVATIGNADVKSRLTVFPALPPGGKYELVLDGAEHSAFTDRALPGESGNRNPNHHRAILAISTAFWDAWLKQDGAARAWLDGNGARSVMEAVDRWQRK
jgi:predicted dienelactone hydrolase